MCPQNSQPTQVSGQEGIEAPPIDEAMYHSQAIGGR